MVSDFRYYSFKEVHFGRRIPFTWMLVIPLIFMVISIDPPLVFLMMFGAYALSGPAHWYWRRRRAGAGAVPREAGDDE
jgi:CDP-diacylglycerol--serine O-phosphatidyltransferase